MAAHENLRPSPGDLDMRAGQQPVDEQVRTFLEHIASHGMLRVALGAFIVGVFLHVCVLYAVLGDGGADRKPTPPSRAPSGGAPPTVAATPTRPADRTSCDAIRGTDYRSEAERRWFLSNCS